MQTIDVNLSRVQNSLADKLIMDCAEDEIKAKLKLIFSIVGLRAAHYPKGQEKQDLHDYVRVKYARKTLSELVLAFDLAICNELDLKPDDVKVYDQFTIAYLAMIMSAYKKWLYQQNKLFKPKPVAMIEEKKELTYQEMSEWVGEWHQKIATEPLDLIPVCFYEFLKIDLSVELKWQYQKLAAEYRKTVLYNLSVNGTSDDIKNYGQFLKMFAANEITGVEVERIKNTAKRMIIKDFLMNTLPGNG